MIIAREGESVCVDLCPDGPGPGPGPGADDEEEDDVGSEARGCGGVGTGSSAVGVRRLYDGLSYGDARSEVASPSGYFRFRDGGGSGGATAGNRTSSLATGGAVDDETDRCRAEDDEAGVEGAADRVGGKGADAGAGTGRVHLISQGGGGGTWAAGALIRCGGEYG